MRALVLSALLAAAAPLPKPLSVLESSAEDLGDAAAAGKWAEAHRLLSRADHATRELSGRADPALLARTQGDLAAAGRLVASKQRLPAAFAANRVSADVVKLYEPFQPTVPVEVMQMDVLMREAQLNGLAGTPAQAKQPLAQAQQLWRTLEQRSPLAGSATARNFQQRLDQVAEAVAAGRAAQLAHAAGRALDGVDQLERVFQNG